MKRYVAKATLCLLAVGWIIPFFFIESPAAMWWWGNPKSAHVHNYPVAVTFLAYAVPYLILCALFIATVYALIQLIQWCKENA